MLEKLKDKVINDLIKALQVIIDEPEHPEQEFDADDDPLPLADEETYTSDRLQRVDKWKNEARQNVKEYFGEEISTDFDELLSTSNEYYKYEEFLNDLLT